MINAMMARARHRSSLSEVHPRRDVLDAKALPLPPYRPAQILQLRRHNVVDRFTRSPDVVRDVITDFLMRHRIPQVLAAVGRPPCASRSDSRRSASGPGRTTSDTTHDWRHRTM